MRVGAEWSDPNGCWKETKSYTVDIDGGRQEDAVVAGHRKHTRDDDGLE